MASNLKRVPYPEHPERCAGTGGGNQCQMFRVPGSDYCMMHGGSNVDQKNKAAALRNYRLTRWRAEIQEKADSSEVKSLRDEIGILRVIMQERLEQCATPMDLILQSQPIADLVMKIEKVVGSCHRLEGSMGQLLDKTAILQFANEVVQIITKHVTDEDQIQLVAEDIMQLVGRVGESQETGT